MPLLDRNSLKQRNAGKVQFNAVREEVLALLDKGYSRRVLHAALRKKSLFTGSYRRFCEYVQGIEKRDCSKKKPEATPILPEKTAVAPDTPAPQPVLSEKTAASTFSHTNRPNINDLL